MSVINPNIVFHLSRGNPYNNKVGMGIDQQVFGKSLGGQIFTEEKLDNNQTIQHSLKTSNNTELFDPIVLSDLVKSKVNYRVLYILNPSSEHVILDNITAEVIRSPYLDSDICDVDIATEGYFTLGELNRPIPNKLGNASNPSIYIDDEYDSTQKISNLSFKKILDANDLPSDIPTNCVLKIWIRRTCIADKISVPDGEYWENIKIVVNEYNDEYSTPFECTYVKEDGRLPLSNWYDYTITPGKGTSIVMKELLPKELDLSTIRPIQTFVKNDKVLIFYYTELGVTRNYQLLVVEPHDTVTKNKYIQVLFDFNENILTTEIATSREIKSVFKSQYDPDRYFLFWKDLINKTDDPQQFFGMDTEYDRISVDEIKTQMWTSEESFKIIAPGYEFRRIVSHRPVHNKIIRKTTELVNVEQFDDLFILFVKDTKNKDIINVPNLNLNRNQLLYVFEKDIISENNNNFNSYPGDGSQILSHRLYPNTLSKEKLITSFNGVKNSSNSVIISDTTNVSKVIDAPRKIKTLLDGTRYIDLNSFHMREFNVTKSFVTYELPLDQTNLTSLFVTSSFAIANDENIYESKNDLFVTTNIMNNIVDGVTYNRAWFQQNIIDSSKTNSLSIPLEWVDRKYKDEWITILGTAPVEENKSSFKLQYNFARNIWQTATLDEDGLESTKIYNYLYGQSVSTSSQPSTASTPSPSGVLSDNPIGKPYETLSLLDMQYVLEPDVYQPISVKVSAQKTYSNSGKSRYSVNFIIYFKGNPIPLINTTLTSTDISSLSYIFLNPNKTLNLRVNYMDVLNGKLAPVDYIVKNLHKAVTHDVRADFSEEFKVNVQIMPKQADYKYFRKITLQNLKDSDVNEKSFVMPILLYGNGYKDTDESITTKISVKYPFDFKKLAINDKSVRFFFDSSFDMPLPFKVGSYDYAGEWAVLWVQINNWNGLNKNLYMFYGKVNVADTKSKIRSQYVSLKSNLYQPFAIGAWFFDNQYYDERLSFASGRICNMGEPVIYEKNGNELSLSQIDKEYMYGIAKVYKSHKFGLELEVPAEESLFFDESIKEDFIKFIKDTATLLKPSYTQIQSINQYGFDILEAGDGSMGETTNKRVVGLVATTPNANVMTYYDRKDDNKYNLLTSFNGFSKKIDWVIAKPIDTPIFKSGVYKINGKLKSDTIKFETPFKDTDYYIFLSSPVNQKIYWQMLCENRFTISASHYLLKEVSWMAFHKDIFGGVYTPNSIFVGKRDITGSTTTPEGEEPSIANMSTWYNHEMLIRPEIGVSNDAGSMTIDPTDPGYSVLLSSNENINIYWKNKESNQFRIKTSSPTSTTIHWLVIRNGVEWWQELE